MSEARGRMSDVRRQRAEVPGEIRCAFSWRKFHRLKIDAFSSVRFSEMTISGICAAAVGRSQHIDNFFYVIDTVKKPPSSDSVSPRIGLKTL